MKVFEPSSTGELNWELDLKLEEDIVAELEEFILLGRLSVVDDALEILRTVLWRHLRFFPVTAEAAAFLIEHELWDCFHDVIDELDARGIEFQQDDEAEFVEYLRTLGHTDFVASKLKSPRVLDDPLISPLISPYLDQRTGRLPQGYLWQKLEHVTYTSPPQLQISEMAAIIAINHNMPLLSSISHHFEALVTHKLYWEAARIFSIACSGAQRIAPNALVLFYIGSWHKKLMNSIDGQQLRGAVPIQARDDVDKCLCALAANTALLNLIAHLRQDTEICYLNWQSLQCLRRWLEAIHHKLFYLVRDRTPRGSYLDRWNEIWLFADDPKARDNQCTVSSHTFSEDGSRSRLNADTDWYRSENISRPTAPTQTIMKSNSKSPQYIHIQWDHNPGIVDDYYSLCKFIDERVANGKKVLVYCVNGAYRSASLIIAYGLFKKIRQDYHSMYTVVRNRSRWVEPDMNRVYGLMNFKEKLDSRNFRSESEHIYWFLRIRRMLSSPGRTEIAQNAAAHPQKTSGTLDTSASPLQVSNRDRFQRKETPPPVSKENFVADSIMSRLLSRKAQYPIPQQALSPATAPTQENRQSLTSDLPFQTSTRKGLPKKIFLSPERDAEAGEFSPSLPIRSLVHQHPPAQEKSTERLQEPEQRYPEGPIRIFDGGVYLCDEPTVEEASAFDVIINVATELENPFEARNPRLVRQKPRNTSDPRSSNEEEYFEYSDSDFLTFPRGRSSKRGLKSSSNYYKLPRSIGRSERTIESRKLNKLSAEADSGTPALLQKPSAQQDPSSPTEEDQAPLTRPI